eukprot:gene7478-7687_t
MLRVRTCPEVKVVRGYGRLYQDQQYNDLFHVPCCDPGQAFVFDFDHVGAGAHDERFQAVTIQGHLLGLGILLLREVGPWVTHRLPVALGPADVYGSVDADAVLTTLTHKITKAVRSQSVSEARLLLRDWLVIFTANYHRNSFMRASAAQLLQLPVELTFTSCPPLQPLPRLVYALLRSPLLSSAAQYHSDLTAFLHHLWCCLPPKELSRAVYPCLTAFADTDTLIAGAPDTLPYPPPQQSKLWRMIQDLKRMRRVTTHIDVVREGSDGAELFYSLLIDDPDELADTPIPPVGQVQQQPVAAAGSATPGLAAGGGTSPSPTGVAQFVEHIKAEVFLQLQPQQ